MSNKYKAVNEGAIHFVTCTIVYWIDLFTKLYFKEIIVDALKHCQKEKGLIINGWCLMPSHLHIICRTEETKFPDFIRDFKTYTSKQIVKTIIEENESRREWLLNQFRKACAHLKRDQTYKVWQNGYHAKEIWSPQFVQQKLNYIHNNPVKEGIVERPEDYLYSSAKDYSGQKGELEIELLVPEIS